MFIKFNKNLIKGVPEFSSLELSSPRLFSSFVSNIFVIFVSSGIFVNKEINGIFVSGTFVSARIFVSWRKLTRWRNNFPRWWNSIPRWRNNLPVDGTTSPLTEQPPPLTERHPRWRNNFPRWWNNIPVTGTTSPVDGTSSHVDGFPPPPLELSGVQPFINLDF